jgi:hypothetical protein
MPLQAQGDVKILLFCWMSLRGYKALEVIEKIIRDVFPGVLRARRLNDMQLVVEIEEHAQPRSGSKR